MFTDALDWITTRLTAAGINAAVDPANLNLPGVWVVPGTISWPRQDAQVAEVTCHLYLVASNSGAAHDLANLDQLTRDVSAVLTLRSAEAVRVTLPNHSPGGLPGYHTTTTVQYTP